jgi:hypothetical protein
MRTPKERLTHLLELAAKGGAARAMLVHELADILLDWPPEYSESAKLPFEALLERALREVTRETRGALAVRFAQRGNAPVEILNELFFAANPAVKDDIIARNVGDVCQEDASPQFDEELLLELARSERSQLVPALACALGVLPPTAADILGDISGQSLAIACKGAHSGRATFSALAVLCDKTRAAEDSYLRLAAYDGVPLSAAERMLSSWRNHAATAQTQAAE